MYRNGKYKLCRLCLCIGRPLINIFEDNNKTELMANKTIEDLLQVKVVKETSCPWLVCSTCLDKLTEFRLFKRRCAECLFVFHHRVQIECYSGTKDWKTNREKGSYGGENECCDIPIDDGKETSDAEGDLGNVDGMSAEAWGHGSPVELVVNSELISKAEIVILDFPEDSGMDPLSTSGFNRMVMQIPVKMDDVSVVEPEVGDLLSGQEECLDIVGHKVEVMEGETTEAPGEEDESRPPLEEMAVEEEECPEDEAQGGSVEEDISPVQASCSRLPLATKAARPSHLPMPSPKATISQQIQKNLPSPRITTTKRPPSAGKPSIRQPIAASPSSSMSHRGLLAMPCSPVSSSSSDKKRKQIHSAHSVLKKVAGCRRESPAFPHGSSHGCSSRGVSSSPSQEIESASGKDLNNVDLMYQLTATLDPAEVTAATSVGELIDKKIDKLGIELKSQAAQRALEVNERFDSLMDMIKAIKENGDSAPANCIEMESRHSLPLNSFQEMEDFAVDIASDNKFSEFMVAYLRDRSCNLLCRNLPYKMFSGAINRTVNEVCAMIMTNDMAKAMCLKNRSALKVSLEDTFPKVIDLVFETVKTKCVTGQPIDLGSVKKSIGEWLRQARLRVGSHKASEEDSY